MKSIKITTIILALIATFASCKKDVINSTPTSSINYYASSEYAKKIEMRKKAQAILTEISTDRAVQEEILQTIDTITKKYEWRDEAVYFKEFLKNNYNTILHKPSITAQKFNAIAYQMEYPDYVPPASIIPGQTPGGGNTNNTLSTYLIDEDEEIYMPYHEDFTVTYNPTCTHQNLAVSETTNGGTIKINNTVNNRTITDAYAQTNACWIVGYFDDNREIPAMPTQPATPVSTQKTILDPIWIDLGYFRSYDPHEGLFRGGPEYRINCTDITILGNAATAFPTTELAINMSRKEASNGTQKRQWIVFDQSWELLETNKRIEVYEDDRDGILNNIKNLIFPIQVQIPAIGVITVNAGKQISNKDEDLGHISYNRATFYNTNVKNADFGHGKDPDGWPYYNHGGGVKYSLPRLMN
ncbi:MAG TPA: hypothetical protein PKA15_11540 [Chitinophagales bacterium]|nr:hypothetical protein [Chitinophagales bacterium]HMW95571.1 hypothetical protein [Chitinophagales bacterium]HMY43752.1 hypothetical protein [Chitinophagales bacterium]HMZ95289.1 hypothetical protein [Chitinophagales bacterium]HNG09632.1 hypothetical protein [Chitinophagales bacterium]